MKRPALGERVVAALLGCGFGALLGLGLAWLFASYPRTTGGDPSLVSWHAWALAGGAAFGLAGAVFGARAGTWLGGLLAAMFDIVKWDNTRPPWWFLLLAAAAGLAWYVWNGGTW
jgi:MFS family permease